jgi:hypothetical protein
MSVARYPKETRVKPGEKHDWYNFGQVWIDPSCTKKNHRGDIEEVAEELDALLL